MSCRHALPFMPLRTHRVCEALLLALGIGILGTGCRSGQETSAQEPIAMPRVAPQVDARRVGNWQGGPEPVSGKLDSGIAIYHQLPAPVAGKAFDLVLRFEEVQGDDAAVHLTSSDGARLLADKNELRWRLVAGHASQIVVQVIAPPGDSYVHVMAEQNGRHSARSIALSLPSENGKRPAGYRGADDKDGSGTPIVRMQAEPKAGPLPSRLP